jgi:hypothetical protein
MENNTAVGEEVASAVGILHVNVMLSGAVITSATTTVLTPIQNGGNRVGNTRGGKRHNLASSIVSPQNFVDKGSGSDALRRPIALVIKVVIAESAREVRTAKSY